jgi:hypothetical protein
MSELKPVLERLRDRFVPPEDGLERLAARRHRKHRNQRVTTIVLTIALLGGTAAGLWKALSAQPPSPASESVVILPGDALDLAVGEGSVWVLTCDRRCGDDGRRSEGSVVRVDPATGRSAKSATVMRPHALAVGEGGVWVLDFWGSNVTRIDVETLRPVSSVHLSLPYEVAPGDRTFVPSYIATGEGAVWVGTVRGAVAKIDPMTNEVAALIELTPDQPDDVAAGEGAVWIGVTPGVKRIDPPTGRVIESIDLGIQPVTVLVADGTIWVEGEEVEWMSGLAPGYVIVGGRVLVGLDPGTGAVETRIPLPSPSRVAVGTGVVWVVNTQTGTLIAVDPADGQPTDQPLFEGGGILAADGRDVWVADGRRVRKISFAPTGPRPERESEDRLGGARLFLAGDGEMWVVDVDEGSVRHLQLPELSAGDPPYRIVRRGDKLVLWGSTATYVLDPAKDGEPQVLAEGSLIFIPSATPDRVWLGIGGPEELSAVREVAIDGRVTVRDTKPPGGRWPVAATETTLAFPTPDGRLDVWDPLTGDVVRRLPGVFPIATYGDHLAWCADLCQTLHVTNVVTGDEVVVSPPPGTYGFEPYTGVFSPDGREIAVTVHTDARPTTRELQLALVDAGAGTTTLVQGTAVEGDVFVDWSPSGESVFISSGVAKRSIIEYQVGADSTRRLPVQVGAFYGMAAA